MEDPVPVADLTPASGTLTDWFIVFLCEITSDPATTFDKKVSDLLALGCDYLGLEFGILAAIEGDTYSVLHAHSPGPSVQPGQVFSLADTYCAQTIAAVGPIGFTRVNGPAR